MLTNRQILACIATVFALSACQPDEPEIAVTGTSTPISTSTSTTEAIPETTTTVLEIPTTTTIVEIVVEAPQRPVEPPPTLPRPPAPETVSVASSVNWDGVAECESGGDWSINTGNGYYGGLQFRLSTWQSVGGSGLPSENSREEQIARAEILIQRAPGSSQWPHCWAYS